MLKHKIAACLLLIFSLSAGFFYTAPSLAYTPKQIYQKAGPGVVFIFASQGSSKGSGGTGSIISQDGLVITAGICAYEAKITGRPDGTAELTRKLIEAVQ